MASEDGTRPLSPEALAEIQRLQQRYQPPTTANLSPTSATNETAGEEDEVTIREDHTQTLSENEAILEELSTMECTGTTLEAIASSHMDMQLWLQILGSSDGSQGPPVVAGSAAC